MDALNLKYKLDWQDRAFLKSFPKSLPFVKSNEFEKLHSRFIVLFNEQVNYISDRQSQSHFIMCAYVLAAYLQEMNKGRDRGVVIQELVDAFKKFGARFIIWSMRLMLWLRLYNRKYIENRTFQDVKRRYGDAFKLVEEKKAQQYTMVISKCAYYDFFNRHQLPELTKIFCAWDNLWSDEINRRNCGIRFQRHSTLANHDENCRFEFHYDK